MKSIGLVVVVFALLAVDFFNCKNINYLDDKGEKLDEKVDEKVVGNVEPVDSVESDPNVEAKQSPLRACKTRGERCNPTWNIFALSECCTDQEHLHCDLGMGGICTDHSFTGNGTVLDVISNIPLLG